MQLQLFEAAASWPDAPLLISAANTWTHRDFRCAVLERASKLAPSEHAEVLLDSQDEDFVLAILARIAAGGVAALFSKTWPRQRHERLAASIAAWQPAARKPGEAIDSHAPIDIVFTSGSSGQARPIVHSLGNHAASADGAQARVAFGPGQRWLASLPLHHVGGLAILFRALRSGGAMALRRQNEDLEHAIVRTQPTHLSLVASQLTDLLHSKSRPLARALEAVQAILLGGGPVPASLIEAAELRRIPVHATWGMTETTAQVATAKAYDAQSVGAVLPGRRLRIVDEEIQVAGPTLALGRVQDSRLLPLCMSDGWFRSGDLGQLIPAQDGEERLVIHGRRDRRFVSGGENISPEEIEEALLSLPGIRAAIVVDVPHERWGKRPVAFVSSQTDSAAAPSASSRAQSDSQSLRKTLRLSLPAYLVPDEIYQLPASTGLKPSLQKLRALAHELSQRDADTKSIDDRLNDDADKPCP